MANQRPTLYQFPISHYCEVARWGLEHKGIAYELVNLVPGPHRSVMKKLGAKHTHTPVLNHAGKVVQGSEQIIDYLEVLQKHPALTPTDPEAASMAHEWARFADRNIGIPLRLYFYQHLLPHRKIAVQLLTQACPWWAKPLYAVAFPSIRKVMRQAMHINEENAQAARNTLLRSLDHIAERLSKRDYLVDNRFTRADLTVVSLLAPCWREISAMPEPLKTFINETRTHEALKWAQQIYRDHRS